MAPLTDNPNVAENDGRTPIYRAAQYGHTEIFKILIPLTDNPNAPDKYGKTPLFWAAYNGHAEIVKILAPFDRQCSKSKWRYSQLLKTNRNYTKRAKK